MADIWKVIIGETFGTMILILLGNGLIANVLLKNSRGNNANWLGVSVGWGVAVTVGAFLSTVSNAHLNPAVTIGFLVAGNKFGFVGSNFAFAPIYIVFQLIGAMLGQLLVWLAYNREYATTSEKDKILSTFATKPVNRNYFWNTITEIIATFVLVMVVLATTYIPQLMGSAFKNLGYFPPIIVGLTVMIIGLGLGGPTGFAINPARDLGPRIVHSLLPIKNKGGSDWSYAFVPVIGPIIGAAIAGGFVQILTHIWQI